MTVQKGEYVYRQGEAASNFFFLEAGQLKSVVDGNDAEKTLHKAPHSFGESALVTNEPRSATVTCRSRQCVCLMMRHRAFDALLGSLEHVIAQNYVYYTLRAVHGRLEVQVRQACAPRALPQPTPHPKQL